MLENTDSDQFCQTVLQLPLLYLRLLYLTDKFRNLGLEGTSWMAEPSRLLSGTTQYVTVMKSNVFFTEISMKLQNISLL